MLIAASGVLALAVASPTSAGPLLTSVDGGDVRAAERAIASGANVNEEDQSGCTALCHAVRMRNAIMVELLLKHGADPNVRDSSGRSPIFSAAHNGELGIMRSLIHHKAYLEFHDSQGGTPLFAAVRADKLEAAELPLDAGADPNALDRRNKSAIAWARSAAMTGLLRKYGAV
jgi:ankyrin repeat protein